jgi:hypothetical protein
MNQAKRVGSSNTQSLANSSANCCVTLKGFDDDDDDDDDDTVAIGTVPLLTSDACDEHGDNVGNTRWDNGVHGNKDNDGMMAPAVNWRDSTATRRISSTKSM